MPPPNHPFANMSPEEFFRRIAVEVAKQVAAQPPKQFVVNRRNIEGAPRQEATSLAQLMAELNDNIAALNATQDAANHINAELLLTMNEMRKLTKIALKRAQ